MLELEM